MIKEILLMLLLMSSPVLALTNSTIYCIGNTTLVENITIYKDDEVSTLMLPVKCDYGCDNTTLVCNPPTYQQNLSLLAIIIAIIVATALLIRWKRH